MNAYILAVWMVALAVIAGGLTEGIKRATKPRQGAPPTGFAAWLSAWLPLVPFAVGGALALVPVDAEGFAVALSAGVRVICGLGSGAFSSVVYQAVKRRVSSEAKRLEGGANGGAAR